MLRFFNDSAALFVIPSLKADEWGLSPDLRMWKVLQYITK